MSKIFILHDEAALLYAYADYIKSLGYEVFATTNVYKFILYSQEINPDIFIIDLGANFDYDYVQYIKSKINNKNIPLILIMEKVFFEKIPPEFELFLFKPFDVAVLEKKIKEYIIVDKITKNMADFPVSQIFYVENKEKVQDGKMILS